MKNKRKFPLNLRIKCEHVRALEDKYWGKEVLETYHQPTALEFSTNTFRNNGLDGANPGHNFEGICSVLVGPLLDDRLKENLKKNPETLKGCPLFSH